MFRGRTAVRSQGAEPITVIASPLAIPPGSRKMSKGNWKPSLMKLFSKKDAAQDSEKFNNLEDNYASISYPIKQGFEEPKVAPIAKSESNDKEHFVRPNPSHRRPSSPETTKSLKETRRRSFIQTITRRKSTKDLQDREFKKFFAAKENEEKGLLRQYREDYIYAPGTAAYIPKHAATDLFNCTKNLNAEPNWEPSTNSIFEPKQNPSHVPEVPERSTRRGMLQEIPANAVSTTLAVPSEVSPHTNTGSFDQNIDFQNFLRESRLAATYAHDYDPFIQAPPKPRRLSSVVMDNILATRQTAEAARQANHMHRSSSISSKHSGKHSRRKSLAVSVSDYIKPKADPRPQTIYYAEPPVVGDWKSMNGKIQRTGSDWGAMGREDVSSRWSRVGGTTKRSNSRDPDAENDERARATRAMAIREGMRRRQSVVPPTGNPSLGRYNQGVARKAEWV